MLAMELRTIVRRNVRSNSVLLRNRLLRIDIDLCESNTLGTRVFLGESVVGRSDSFARTTPICVDLRELAAAYESRTGIHTICDNDRVGAESLAKLSG
jgi:hypothetical protein